MPSLRHAFTTPNLITAVRIVLLPVVILGLLQGSPIGVVIAYIAACLSELSDVTDGYIARSRGETSDLGKLFDPMADSISRFTLFLVFMQLGYAALWMVIVFYLRDILIAYYRSSAAAAGIVISARKTGKIKAMFQSFATLASFLLILFSMSAEIMQSQAAKIAILVSLGVSVLIFVVYMAYFKIRGWLMKLLIGLAIPAGAPLIVLTQVEVPAFDPSTFTYWLVGIAAVYTFYSLIDYTHGYLKSMGWIGNKEA